jgi:hypothetical protein
VVSFHVRGELEDNPASIEVINPETARENHASAALSFNYHRR